MLSRLLLVEAAVAVGTALAGSAVCPTDLPLSCQNTTVQTDTCCFNTPGGILLQTQFWDTDPSTGPADSWTVHGLWPDNCDGTYEEYCDASREVTNVTAILNATVPCTLRYMEKYWKDYTGDDESFWEHEFNKHGTCISSLDAACYADYQPTMEVPDYFTRTVRLFRTLPSYDWLAAAGIVPSTTATYTLAQIQAAVAANRDGHTAIVGCNSQNEIDELWYYYNVRGSIQSGEFVAVDPVGSSSCKATGIKYLPKYTTTTPTSTTSTATATTSASAVPSGALSGKGYLYVSAAAAASTPGFLISGGTWYRGGGTPATYTATPSTDGSAGFTLNTSKGICAVLESDGSLSCASTITTGSVFGWNGSYLTYNGSSVFYAASLPTGTAQGTVYTTSQAVSLQVTWTAR